MAEEAVPGTVPENATTTEDAGIPPTDFREYVKWRETGELPAKQPSAAAAEEEPQAKTEPDSETVESQEPGEDEEVGDDGPSPRRPGPRQRKIDKLTKEIAELKQQIQNQQQPPPPEKKAAAAEPAQPTGKPKLADFQTLEAYQEALTDWKMDQREQARQQQEAAQKAQQAAEQLQKDWANREKAARAAHADYDDIIDSVRAPEGPGVLAGRQAMLEDEYGAEILYYLGTHPAELKRIAALSPVGAVKEIGKLSAILGKSQVPVNGKPAVSTAPRPPSPVTRPGKTTSDSLDDPEVQRDFKRWNRLREAQLKGR